MMRRLEIRVMVVLALASPGVRRAPPRVSHGGVPVRESDRSRLRGSRVTVRQSAQAGPHDEAYAR
jgi:hypothetical protein